MYTTVYSCIQPHTDMAICVPRLYWRPKSPTSQPWSCTRTWVLSETSGCSDTTWTEWTRCGSNCGSARGKKRGRGRTGQRVLFTSYTISLTASALPWSFHSYIHTHTHRHTQTHLCTNIRSMHIGMHRHANTPYFCPWPLNNSLGRNGLTSHLMFSWRGPWYFLWRGGGEWGWSLGWPWLGTRWPFWPSSLDAALTPDREVWGSSSEGARPPEDMVPHQILLQNTGQNQT